MTTVDDEFAPRRVSFTVVRGMWLRETRGGRRFRVDRWFPADFLEGGGYWIVQQDGNEDHETWFNPETDAGWLELEAVN